MEITNENIQELAKENVILANKIYSYAREHNMRNEQWYLNWQDDLNIVTFDDQN